MTGKEQAREEEEEGNGRVRVSLISRKNESERVKKVARCNDVSEAMRSQGDDQQQGRTQVEQGERRSQNDTEWNTSRRTHAEQPGKTDANERRVVHFGIRVVIADKAEVANAGCVHFPQACVVSAAREDDKVSAQNQSEEKNEEEPKRSYPSNGVIIGAGGGSGPKALA
jgi:hypothetical protein